MKPTKAALLTALVIALVLLIVWLARAPRARRRGDSYCPGPYNIALYDWPYFYPAYVARASVEWDGDKRCASYCQQPPCVVWCR
jgi:hypothetical protein